MGSIPKNYELDEGYDAKKILSRKYRNTTVGDLREFIADLPDDATVWVTRYDEAADDIFIRPLESFGSSNDGKTTYVTL